MKDLKIKLCEAIKGTAMHPEGIVADEWECRFCEGPVAKRSQFIHEPDCIYLEAVKILEDAPSRNNPLFDEQEALDAAQNYVHMGHDIKDYIEGFVTGAEWMSEKSPKD